MSYPCELPRFALYRGGLIGMIGEQGEDGSGRMAKASWCRFCGAGIRGAACRQYFGCAGIQLGAVDGLPGLLFSLRVGAVYAIPGLSLCFVLRGIRPFRTAGLGYGIGTCARNEVGLLRKRGAKY